MWFSAGRGGEARQLERSNRLDNVHGDTVCHIAGPGRAHVTKSTKRVFGEFSALPRTIIVPSPGQGGGLPTTLWNFMQKRLILRRYRGVRRPAAALGAEDRTSR